MERGVGADASDLADLAGADIEGGHGGVGAGAFEESVEAAAVAVFIGGVDPLEGGVGGFPNAIGLGWEDGGAAGFLGEETGGGEGLVADGFGGEPEAGAAGEEAVGGVFFETERGDFGGLLVGGAEDDGAEEGLELPAVFTVVDGEPVEEFGMVRGFSSEQSQRAKAARSDGVSAGRAPKAAGTCGGRSAGA